MKVNIGLILCIYNVYKNWLLLENELLNYFKNYRDFSISQSLANWVSQSFVFGFGVSSI